MDLTVNLAPSYRDLKDPTTRHNFDDTVEQKRVIDLRTFFSSLLNNNNTLMILICLSYGGDSVLIEIHGHLFFGPAWKWVEGLNELLELWIRGETVGLVLVLLDLRDDLRYLRQQKDKPGK